MRGLTMLIQIPHGPAPWRAGLNYYTTALTTGACVALPKATLNLRNTSSCWSSATSHQSSTEASQRARLLPTRRREPLVWAARIAQPVSGSTGRDLAVLRTRAHVRTARPQHGAPALYARTRPQLEHHPATHAAVFRRQLPNFPAALRAGHQGPVASSTRSEG